LARGKSLKVGSLKLWDTNNASTEQKVGFSTRTIPWPDKKLPYALKQKPFVFTELCLLLLKQLMRTNINPQIKIANNKHDSKGVLYTPYTRCNATFFPLLQI
jgi:hypothetical protein